MMEEWNQLTDEQHARWERRLQVKREQLGLPPYKRPVPNRIAEDPRSSFTGGEVAPDAGVTAGAGGGFTAVNG